MFSVLLWIALSRLLPYSTATFGFPMKPPVLSKSCPDVTCPADTPDTCPNLSLADLLDLFATSLLEPDRFRSPEQLITSKGYPVEKHTVTTTDGYILTLFRIPRGKDDTDDGTKRPVVFCQHGFLSQSVDWTSNFPEDSWGFIFADNGFDVWMGNVRGNANSLKHETLTILNPKFWAFSIDEHALIDLPNSIDYVLQKTGQPKLSYVGHSMGTTMMFALLSEQQQYNQKVPYVAGLAPVMSLDCSSDALIGLSYLAPVILFEDRFNILPQSPPNDLLSFGCSLPVGSGLCVGLADDPCANQSRFAVYAHNFPAGSSGRVLKHFTQIILSESMRKFDYGATENQRRYGASKPPVYDVSKITTKVGLYYACSDPLADLRDVQFLRENIPQSSLIDDYLVQQREFNHLDFVISIYRAKELIQKVLARLNQYK